MSNTTEQQLASILKTVGERFHQLGHDKAEAQVRATAIFHAVGAENREEIAKRASEVPHAHREGIDSFINYILGMAFDLQGFPTITKEKRKANVDNLRDRSAPKGRPNRIDTAIHSLVAIIDEINTDTLSATGLPSSSFRFQPQELRAQLAEIHKKLLAGNNHTKPRGRVIDDIDNSVSLICEFIEGDTFFTPSNYVSEKNAVCRICCAALAGHKSHTEHEINDSFIRRMKRIKKAKERVNKKERETKQ